MRQTARRALHFINRRAFLIGLALTIAAGGIAAITTSRPASASSRCDKVNIIYCGVTSITNFQQVYASNKSGHADSPTVKKDYTDLHTIYSAQGISASDVSSMNTSNTKLGRVYKDGTVKVDSKTVGTNAKISARFSVSGATPISGTNAYIRSVTESFQSAYEDAFVRFDDNDVMKFAIVVDCGNGVTATAVKPAPALKPAPTPTPTPPAPTPTPTPPAPTPAPVTPAAQPQVLVNTGAGNVAALFVTVTATGAAGYYYFLRRRLSAEA